MASRSPVLWAALVAASVCGLLASQPAPSLAEVFASGQKALANGDLAAAERAFRKVLQADPGSAAAHVNLGVVAMRRKEWQKALNEFRAAQKLSPEMPGIELNMGLAYFRQGKYAQAIPHLEAYLHGQPDSAQARELLGLCYFFADRYAEAATMLEPLWKARSSDLNYLYVLAVSAGKASQEALADRAMRQLFEVGQDSADVDLFVGRAHLYRNEDQQAVEALQRALQKNPRLPYGQYYMGMAYRRLNKLEKARLAFEAEVKNQPEAAYAWNQLGIVETKLDDWDSAGLSFRKAIALDPILASAYLGLAGVYRQAGQLKEELAQLDLALQLEPQSYSIHYQRGLLLLRLNRTEEGRAEMQKVKQLLKPADDRVDDEVSGRKVIEPPPSEGKQ